MKLFKPWKKVKNYKMFVMTTLNKIASRQTWSVKSGRELGGIVHERFDQCSTEVAQENSPWKQQMWEAPVHGWRREISRYYIALVFCRKQDQWSVNCTVVTALADRKNFFIERNLCLIVGIQTTEQTSAIGVVVWSANTGIIKAYAIDGKGKTAAVRMEYHWQATPITQKR